MDMNCQTFREQLDVALDERRAVSNQADSADAGGADVISHAESCADCRLLYEEHVLIEAALAAWMPLRTAFDLTDRVIEAAREEGLISSNGTSVAAEVVSDGVRTGLLGSEHSPYVLTAAGPSDDSSSFFHRRSTIWAAVASAALIFTASTVFFYIRIEQVAQDDQQPQQLFPDQQPEPLDESQDQVADISHLVADAQSAWQGITSRVSHQASGLKVFVPDLKNELGISGVAESLDMDPDASDPDGDPESPDSSEPSAVEKAFDFLFDDAESVGIRTI
jgi:hypothetical protein